MYLDRKSQVVWNPSDSADVLLNIVFLISTNTIKKLKV